MRAINRSLIRQVRIIRSTYQCALLSTSADSNDYIEKWQASTVKPNAFYEYHATDKPKKYFYSMDLQGRVFLEETMPKNIATSLKNVAFLDFFFKNLRPCIERDLKLLPPESHSHYPYVSYCGVERNFVRPADAVLVFHSLVEDTDGSQRLSYGGSLCQAFEPKYLAISQKTGRLYHKLVGDTTPLHRLKDHYGLVKSSVAVALSEYIVIRGDNEGEDGALHSGMTFTRTNEDSFSIPWLPEDSEPGPWAMPFFES